MPLHFAYLCYIYDSYASVSMECQTIRRVTPQPRRVRYFLYAALSGFLSIIVGISVLSENDEKKIHSGNQGILKGRLSFVYQLGVERNRSYCAGRLRHPRFEIQRTNPETCPKMSFRHSCLLMKEIHIYIHTQHTHTHT